VVPGVVHRALDAVPERDLPRAIIRTPARRRNVFAYKRCRAESAGVNDVFAFPCCTWQKPASRSQKSSKATSNFACGAR
jgi:hypothetical protein